MAENGERIQKTTRKEISKEQTAEMDARNGELAMGQLLRCPEFAISRMAR